jgi:hypothetical protein
VLFPLAFPGAEGALVIPAVETPLAASSEFIAPPITANADQEAVAPGEIMLHRQRADRSESTIVLQRHLTAEERHAVHYIEFAAGHSAHHTVIDDLPGGAVGPGSKVEKDFLRIRGEVIATNYSVVLPAFFALAHLALANADNLALAAADIFLLGF